MEIRLFAGSSCCVTTFWQRHTGVYFYYIRPSSEQTFFVPRGHSLLPRLVETCWNNRTIVNATRIGSWCCRRLFLSNCETVWGREENRRHSWKRWGWEYKLGWEVFLLFKIPKEDKSAKATHDSDGWFINFHLNQVRMQCHRQKLFIVKNLLSDSVEGHIWRKQLLFIPFIIECNTK